MDLGVYVNKTPNGELTLYRCNTAREKNMRAEGVEVGQWKVFELGKGYDCEVACRHSVRTMPNGDQRLELVTTAAYIRFSLYSGLLREECQNYLYSPLIGKIAIGCGCGKLEPGTLYDIKAVWIPPNTALFRWLRTVELSHFVVPSGGIRRILNPNDHYFLQNLHYEGVMATEIYETTIRGHAGVVEDPIVVDLEDEIKGIGDVVHVNLLPLKVQPGKVLLYGKQDRRVKRERHEPLNGTGIIKVLNGPKLKPPAEKPKPWYKKDRFAYNKPTESGDMGLRTRMLAYYNELREPLLVKPEQRALFCNGFAQTKQIIALVVCYKEETQEAKVYNPELLHEVYLVDVHVPIELAIWVKCLVPLHGAALRAKFVARVDQTQVPFLATPVNFHKQCAIVVQLYVPTNFDQKTNCLVETSFVPRAIARDIDNSRRGQTFFGTIIRVKSCQRGMYPHVAWGVPREIDPENE